jgi:hypothetical protein
MKIRHWEFALVLALPAAFVAAPPAQAQAQSQQAQQAPQRTPSSDAQQAATADQQAPATLGDAARRARDQRKDQAKPAHTWDNDNIPKAPNEINVVGPASDDNAPPAAAKDSNSGEAGDTPGAASNAAAPGSANGSASAPGAPANANDADAKRQTESQLSAAKDLVQSLQKDLDILVRQFTLDQQQFYSKPNFAADKDGAARLKDESETVEAKRQEVAAAQAKVAELQAKLGPASADPSKPN